MSEPSREEVDKALSAWFADSGNDKTAMKAALEAAAKVRADAKDATIARLEAEVAELKQKNVELLDHANAVNSDCEQLEAENAALRERAEGLARECQAWRECDIARANDDNGVEPSGLSEASYDLSKIMAKTDAAGWLTANGGGGGVKS